MPEPARYTYRVAYSPEDGEHVATVAEFASLSRLAPTPEDALTGLAGLVREVLADITAAGEPVPQPRGDGCAVGAGSHEPVTSASAWVTSMANGEATASAFLSTPAPPPDPIQLTRQVTFSVAWYTPPG